MTTLAPAAGADRRCPGCQSLFLKALLKCASIPLGDDHEHLNQEMINAAHLKTPPLFLVIEQLRAAASTCSICRLLYRQISRALPEDADVVFIYHLKDPDGRLNGLEICYGDYYPYAAYVATIHCYADAGE